MTPKASLLFPTDAYLKRDTVSASLLILLLPVGLPLKMERGGRVRSRTIVPYLSKIVYEREMKRGELEQRTLSSLICSAAARYARLEGLCSWTSDALATD